MGKTYLERKNPQGPYVFISYSHKDQPAVEKTLTALHGLGADFWYDSKLRGGQDWFEIVKEVTAKKQCAGIIYFISPDFVFSDACRQEFELYNSLKQSHDKFDAVCILTDESGSENLNDFIGSSFTKLMSEHSDQVLQISEKINQFSKKFGEDFSADKLYYTVPVSRLDGDQFVNKLFKETFAAWGCASEEVDKLDVLKEDGLVYDNYRVKCDCRVAYNSVNSADVEWKAFSYKGNVISAIPVLKELYETTCCSLAAATMASINKNVNVSLRDDFGEKQIKHFKFVDEEFLDCVIKNEDGGVFRFLRANEHEKFYLQIKEALESVAVADAADDGYFFVQDNQDNILFADRESDDVYRHIHVDAYASVLPVMDIDYVKFKAYISKKSKA